MILIFMAYKFNFVGHWCCCIHSCSVLFLIFDDKLWRREDNIPGTSGSNSFLVHCAYDTPELRSIQNPTTSRSPSSPLLASTSRFAQSSSTASESNCKSGESERARPARRPRAQSGARAGTRPARSVSARSRLRTSAAPKASCSCMTWPIAVRHTMEVKSRSRARPL